MKLVRSARVPTFVPRSNAFIATVSIIGAGIAALISMGLVPEVALAVLAII